MKWVFALAFLGAALCSMASSEGCLACNRAISAMSRTTQENPLAFHGTLVRNGDSMCRHAGFHRNACEGIIGHVGEDVLIAALVQKDSSAACSFACDDTGADMLWTVGGGALKPDEEDRAQRQAEVVKTKQLTDSDLQKDVKEDAEARRRREVQEAKAETDKKVAEAVAAVTAKVEENTKKAVEEAEKRAVEAAHEKWVNAWRHREWPVNVKVPAEASKLACTDATVGRIAFRDNNFYGCKTHCVQECKQCNCRQETTTVEDKSCSCFKEQKKEVCDQCCEQKCGPEWLNFANCARQCESCDCKEEHGIKVCQQCCKEVCAPKWSPDPI